MPGKMRMLNPAEKPRFVSAEEKNFNNEVFDGLARRNESSKKIVGRHSDKLIDATSHLKYTQSKKAYIQLGLRYAEKIFGEKLKGPKYLKAAIEHLTTEYDLIREHKMSEVVYRRGLSPFFVIEFRKELAKALPQEFSKMEPTIAQSILAGRYPDISSAIARLKEISTDAQTLPKEFEHLRGSICYKVFISTYSSVSEAVTRLRKISDEIKKLGEEDPVKIKAILSKVFDKGGTAFSAMLEINNRKVKWKHA